MEVNLAGVVANKIMETNCYKTSTKKQTNRQTDKQTNKY